MSIVVGCPQCKAKLKAPDRLRGKMIVCPRCKGPVQVGTADPPPPDQPPEEIPTLSEADAPSPEPVLDAVAVDDPFADLDPSLPSAPLTAKADDFHLPGDFDRKLRAGFYPNEVVVWAGQPLARLIILRSLGGAFVGLAFAGASVVVMSMIRGAGGPPGLPAFVGLFILVGLAAAFYPFWRLFKTRRPWYVITNRRAIILAPGWFGVLSKSIYGASDLGSMRRTDSWLVSNAGDLAFEEYHFFTWSGHGSTRQLHHEVVQYGFLGVDRVFEVERILRETLLEPRRTTGHQPVMAGSGPAASGRSSRDNTGLWVAGTLACSFFLLCGTCGGAIWWVGRSVSSAVQSVGDAVAQVQEEQGPIGVDEALVELAAADPYRQQAAANRLARTPLDPKNQAKVAAALEPLLRNTGASVRSAALEALLVWAVPDNVPALAGRLKDDKFSPQAMKDRDRVMQILGRLKDRRAVTALVPYLSNHFEHESAERALQAIGPAAEPEVVAYYHHPDQATRDRARALLARFGTKPSVILDQTLEDLQSKDRAQSQSALEELGRCPVIEDRRAEVIEAIEVVLRDADTFTARAAARVLITWAGRENRPLLIELLENRDPFIAETAMQGLAKFPDRDAAAHLARLLAQPRYRNPARAALVKMGPVAEPEVRKLLTDASFVARYDACSVLRSIGTKASVPALEDTAKDRVPKVASAAQDALREIAKREKAE